MIYLDYSANTPADPQVLDRFCSVERRCIGNANSHHQAGTAARAEIDAATLKIAALLGVQPAEIIYTSGASESNNFALKGLARLSRHAGRHIISTPLEHSSVSGTLTALQEQGYEIDLLDIRRDGTVDLDHLKELLRPDTVAVAVTRVDSELGVVQPVEEIAAILKDYPNCHLHVDATQAVGKIPVSFEGVDTMSLTAHKFYGLNGIGLLLKRRNLALEPLIHGGESTTIYRSGTPTVALASSLACALELAVENLPERGTPRGPVPAPRGAHQQPRKCHPAHPEPQRPERKGHGLSAGTGRPRRLRLGQISLLVGRSALPRSVCRQPGPPQCPLVLAHQSEPSDHRGRDPGIFTGVRRLLPAADRRTRRSIRRNHETRTRTLSDDRTQHHQKIPQRALDSLHRSRQTV